MSFCTKGLKAYVKTVPVYLVPNLIKSLITQVAGKNRKLPKIRGYTKAIALAIIQRRMKLKVLSQDR